MSIDATALPSRSLARRLLRVQRVCRGGSGVVSVVDSGSMAPLIRANVKAEVDWRASGAPLRPGTLVLANTAGDLLVVHRALAARSGPRGPQLLQMADNVEFGNPYAAAWFDEADLLGSVRRLRGHDGHLLYDAGAPWWRFVDRVMAGTGRWLWRGSQQHLSLRASALRLARLIFMRAATEAWRAGRRASQQRDRREAYGAHI